jgi:hypothetical protein
MERAEAARDAVGTTQATVETARRLLWPGAAQAQHSMPIAANLSQLCPTMDDVPPSGGEVLLGLN